MAAVSGVAAARPRRGRPAATPCVAQDVRGLVGEVLQLAPVHLAARAVEALVDHRQLVARVLVADVRGDVVALGDMPLVRRDSLLVGLMEFPRTARVQRRHR